MVALPIRLPALHLLSLLFACSGALAQTNTDPLPNGSPFPLFLIETDGAEIQDEPKITARLEVIDNGPGARNHLGDPPAAYDGWIGIEKRGNGSLPYPKNSYGMETRDAVGENLDVSLAGLPAENDWVLYAAMRIDPCCATRFPTR